MKFLVGGKSDGIYQALHDAGVIQEDPHNVARVVIDLKVGEPARYYVQGFLDSKLIDVIVKGGLDLNVREVGGL